jgi:hypothetical protein
LLLRVLMTHRFSHSQPSHIIAILTPDNIIGDLLKPQKIRLGNTPSNCSAPATSTIVPGQIKRSYQDDNYSVQ